MHNIMDSLFNGMAASEFYRAQVFPELFPHEKPMLPNRWPKEDQEMFCGPACHAATLPYTRSEAGKGVNDG
jgi:hypothetical protein